MEGRGRDKRFGMDNENLTKSERKIHDNLVDSFHSLTFSHSLRINNPYRALLEWRTRKYIV